MNEREFESMMEEIDAGLRGSQVPIHARAFQAIADVSKRMKTELVVRLQPQSEIVGRYDASTLSAHIHAWCRERYGDRLKIRFGPGSVAILIRGDAWRLELPRVFGTARFACDPDLEKYKGQRLLRQGQVQPTYNVLNCIDEFPSGLAASLSVEERKEILAVFHERFLDFAALESIADRAYVKEALADLEAAVVHILSRPPQYGLSKWSSLQFVEKLLKSFLAGVGAPIPRKHNLAGIAKLAQANGLSPVGRASLGRIQCPAGVRYGEVRVTLQEAIAAHQESLAVSRSLAEQVRLT